MQQYLTYEVADFAIDDAFIEWCFVPNAAQDQAWADFVATHPHKKKLIEEARQFVLDVHSIEKEASEGDYEQEIWTGIEDNIVPTPQLLKTNNRLKWSIAASLAIVVCAMTFLYMQPFEGSKIVSQDWVNYHNTTANTQTINLADGSEVVLEPFSSLKYPTAFNGDDRAVFLKGEAFFDVARDTLKPFMVYANETITKVLGTSFVIKAFEGEETVEVDVKSGKVAVYAKVEANKKGKKRHMIIQADEEILLPIPNKKLEVTPNQKVVFDKKVATMSRHITTLPKVIQKVETLPQFNFEDEPVAKVLAALEQVYGIQINFHEQDLKNCTITTRLNNETLFQKLEILCIALDLSFIEKDAVIYLSGKGC